MSSPEPFRLGVSFHSFTNEYCSFKVSFEDMMQWATQLGGGVEIVGPSHHRGFPEVSDEFERVFKSSIERNGLTPTSYGSYADPFMLPDRDLSEDEMVEYTIPQIKGAAKLGFPVVRLQYFVYPVIERLLPYAEKHDVKLGYELHVPLMIEAPLTQELIHQVERISSPHLGLIPDMGIFAHSVPAFAIAGAEVRGVDREIVARAVELWNAQTAMTDALSELQRLGLQKNQIVAVERFWGSFGHSQPEALRTIMPYIIHVHGKFFSMQGGTEPNLRYEEVVRELLAGGYSGWMSSEFEGEASDSFAVVKEHQEMVRNFIDKYRAAQAGPRAHAANTITAES
jgi:sugar phosphate isomerase/epimerase